MNKKFKVGMVRARESIFGCGNWFIECIYRTESTVTFRTTDDHDEVITYPIEVDVYGVEVAELWEYKGFKGYVSALTEEEYDKLHSQK